MRLIAYGKTNLEIAEELAITDGTARRHVANSYEKIGATNRVEAGDYANQHGITVFPGNTFGAARPANC